MTTKLTSTQLEAILHKWQADMQQADSLIDPVIEMAGLSPESRICSAVWGLQSALTTAVAAVIGTTTDWLEWHVHENDYGRMGLTAGPDGEHRPIRGVKDLAWVISVDR